MDAGENLGAGSCSVNDNNSGTNYGKPIDIRLGNEHFSHTDVVLEGPATLTLARYYNSHPSASTGSFGKGWTHSFDRQVQVDVTTGHAAVRIASGASRFFDSTTGGFAPRVPGRNLTLTSTGAGFELLRGQSTETYNAAGNLIRIETLDGHTTIITRNANEKIQQVQLDGMASLSFTYGANGLVSKVTDSTNRSWTYTYDANNSLVSVINPDTTGLTYHYEDPNYPHAVTGITNELGVRYATIQYDAEGRAISSELANGVQRYDVAYNGSLSRSIQGPDLGAAGHEITLTPDRGKLHNTKLTTGLGAISKSLNTDGLIAAKTSGGGRTTEYLAHDTKGNPTQIIKAAGTTEQVTQQITYHPTLSVPVEVHEPSVYAGAEKVTSTTWDAVGNPTAITKSGFTPDGLAVSRTINMEYNGPYHQLTKIDGARTDVNDWMLFEYWPIDSSPNSARLRRAIDASGTVSFDNAQYSPTGKLLSYDLTNGISVSMIYYPGSDRLEKTIQSDGTISRTTHWTYNAAGKVETITTNFGTPDALTVTMAYDDALRLTRVTDAEGNYVQYTLDDNGNATNVSQFDDTGALLQTLDSLYDDYGRLQSISSGALLLASQVLGPDDELLSSTDGNGVRTDYQYDGLLRLTQEVRDSEGGYKPVDFAYDVANQVTSNTVAGDITTSYTYDDLGNRVSETSPDRGMLIYTHDPAGNTTFVTNALGQIASMSYDAAGRPVMIDRDGTNNDVGLTYDAAQGCANGTGKLCQITDSSGSVTYSYTPFGELTSKVRTIDGVSYTTSYSYDANGMLVTMTLPTGRTLTLGYDAFGHPESISDASHTYVSAIDWRGDDLIGAITSGNGLIDNRTYSANLARLVGQDIGTVENRGYEYDNNGNILSITNALPRSYQYDALNRLVIDQDTQFEYDDNGNRMSQGTYPTPTLNSSFNNAVGYWKFDELLGSSIAVNQIPGGSAGTYSNVTLGETGVLASTAAGFNSDDSVDLGFNTNLTNEFTIEAWINPSAVQNDPYPNIVGKRSFYATSITDFPLALIWYVSTSEFKFLLSAGDDYTWELILTAPGVPDTWQHVAAVYRANGQSELWVNGVMVASGTMNGSISSNTRNWVVGKSLYEYGAGVGTSGFTGQIDEVAIHDKALDAATIQAHASGQGYEPPVSSSAYAYETGTNRLATVGNTGITRDASGNRTSDQNGNRAFHYDSAGRLIEIREAGVSVASYAYNHLNQRVSKTLVDGSLMHYHHDDSGRLWSETDGQGNALRDYVWMGDIPVAMVDYTGLTERVTYLHADHLNTPRYATDETGTLVWQWSSDAFGNGAPNEDPDGDGTAITLNLRFPGQYYDAESGLHYNWNRYYDPAIGRYITSDPIGLDGGLNTFGYVGGNPLKYSDPKGLMLQGIGFGLNPIVWGGGAAIAATWWAAHNKGIDFPWDSQDDGSDSCNDGSDDKCEKQLELEETLCEAIAGPRYSAGAAQAITVCKKAAFERYTKCLRGVPVSEWPPLTGVETPI